MSSERWEHLWRLFHQALDLDPRERREFLAALGDPALESELRSLIEAHERQDTLLDRSPLGPPPVGAGESVGAWRLVRELGAGGMGVVWLAERADGAYEQRAALKLLAPGWVTPSLEARFRRERQILARLKHPNIASLLDGGTRESGQPYFVMEYVDGVPLHEYVRDHEPSVDERLRLFLRICDAVDHAHRHLVLHRDLKPANIPVDDDGNPKLLDFGVSRLLGHDTGEPITRPAERLLTPEYASPEQLRGDTVGTAADCFSLGVILYELLTDERPWQLDGVTAQKALAIIESTHPTLPSNTAWTSGNRTLASQLKGDLDRIVAKAIHPDPNRRYSSARELAGDIDCHRRGLPVGARPDTWRYRTGKFLRRHRAAVAASALAGILLIGLTVALGINTLRLNEALDQARQETQRAETLSGFLTDLFLEADPEHHAGSPLTVKDLIEQGVRRADEAFINQPALKAQFLTLLGRIHTHLGEFQRADRLLTRARRVHESAGSLDWAIRAETDLTLGQLRQQTGDHAAAARLARRVLSGSGKTADRAEQRAHARLLLATALQFQGKLDAAQAALGETDPAFATRDAQLAGEIALRRGALAWARGDYAAAQEEYETAKARFTEQFGAAHPQVARAQNAVAATLYRQGRMQAAESAYRETLELRQAVFGDDHPDTAETRNHLGAVLIDRGAHDQALPLLERALADQRSAYGADSPELTSTLNNLALALTNLNRRGQAATHYREAIRINRAAHGEPHADVAVNLANLGLLYVEQNAFDKAGEALSEALTMQRELYPEDHPATAFTLNHLGRSNLKQGHFAEAEAYFEEAMTLRQRFYEPGHHRIGETLYWQGRLALARGAFETAVARLDRAENIRRQTLGADDPRTLETAGFLGVALIQTEDEQRGQRLARDSVARLADHPRRRDALNRALEASR